MFSHLESISVDYNNAAAMVISNSGSGCVQSEQQKLYFNCKVICCKNLVTKENGINYWSRADIIKA